MRLADGIAAVLALDAAGVGVLFAAIAAEVVVADAVVDKDKGDVGANVACVLAPETGQDVCRVCGAGERGGEGLWRRERVEVRAGCGAWFV